MKKILFTFLVIFFSQAAFSQKLEIFEKSFQEVGLKDANGKIIFKPIYRSIVDDGYHYILYGKNWESATLLSYEGNILIPPKYLDLKLSKDTRYYKATAKNAQYQDIFGYVDATGKEVVPVIYKEIDNISEVQYLITKGQNSLFGAIAIITENGNTTFKEIIPPSHYYLEIDFWEDGRAVFYADNFNKEIASFDGNGKVMQDFVNWHQSLNYFVTDARIVEDMNTGKYALCNPYLQNITPFSFDYIQRYKTNSNFYVLRQGNYMGLMDEKGKTILELKYDNIDHLECNMLAAQLNKKWGITNFDGKILLPFEFDSMKNCQGNEVFLKKNKLWNLYDVQAGKMISYQESYQKVADAFIPLQQKILIAIDEFADAHFQIRNTKNLSDVELQTRYNALKSYKGKEIMDDILEARQMLSKFLKEYPAIPPSDKIELENVYNDLGDTWYALDRGKDYREIIFISKLESIDAILEDAADELDK
jgi:hypothetical protein